jgi:hypothetical protein
VNTLITIKAKKPVIFSKLQKGVKNQIFNCQKCCACDKDLFAKTEFQNEMKNENFSVRLREPIFEMFLKKVVFYEIKGCSK